MLGKRGGATGHKKKRIRKKELLAAPGKKLNETAVRALHEAAERRRVYDPLAASTNDYPQEQLEPTRYGDWEAGGKCSDF